MWCLPTHKRPGKLQRFIESMSATDRIEHVTLMVCFNDPFLTDYQRLFLKLPHNWNVYLGAEVSCGDKMNKMTQIAPDEKFYGLLTDDVMLDTPGMLATLRQTAESGKVTWPNDGVHGPRAATHAAVPAKLVKAMGFWAHPKFPHNGLDTVIYRVSEAMGLSLYRPDLYLTVKHPSNGFADEMDDTYRDAEFYNELAREDLPIFERDELPALIEKVKSYYGQQKE